MSADTASVNARIRHLSSAFRAKTANAMSQTSEDQKSREKKKSTSKIMRSTHLIPKDSAVNERREMGDEAYEPCLISTLICLFLSIYFISIFTHTLYSTLGTLFGCPFYFSTHQLPSENPIPNPNPCWKQRHAQRQMPAADGGVEKHR